MATSHGGTSTPWKINCGKEHPIRVRVRVRVRKINGRKEHRIRA